MNPRELQIDIKVGRKEIIPNNSYGVKLERFHKEITSISGNCSFILL